MLPDHMPMYRSLLGSVLSLTTVIIIAFYAVFKFAILVNRQDFNIKQYTRENFYDSSFSFSQIDGFQVAAAVTSFDGNPNPIEDPTYGTVKIYMKQWGVENKPGVFFTGVAMRDCQPSDFNFENEKNPSAKFFPVDEFSKKTFDSYSKKLKCIDETNTPIFGSYDRDQGSNLMVVFERCINSLLVKCKTDAEIDEWMQDKYLVTLENQKKFDQDSFQ